MKSYTINFECLGNMHTNTYFILQYNDFTSFVYELRGQPLYLHILIPFARKVVVETFHFVLFRHTSKIMLRCIPFIKPNCNCKMPVLTGTDGRIQNFVAGCLCFHVLWFQVLSIFLLVSEEGCDL